MVAQAHWTAVETVGYQCCVSTAGGGHPCWPIDAMVRERPIVHAGGRPGGQRQPRDERAPTREGIPGRAACAPDGGGGGHMRVRRVPVGGPASPVPSPFGSLPGVPLCACAGAASRKPMKLPRQEMSP